MTLSASYRTSALSPSNWRAQRTVVHSINRPGALSKANIPTGATPPQRDYPSSSIPRHGSLVFHPTEMLYGVGGPDGTGELEWGMFRSPRLNAPLLNSTRHWVQASLGLYIDHRWETVILHHDIFSSPFCTPLYSILSSFRPSYCCFFLRSIYHPRCPFCCLLQCRLCARAVVHRDMHPTCYMYISELSRTVRVVEMYHILECYVHRS